MRRYCFAVLAFLFLFFNIVQAEFYTPNENITISAIVRDAFGNLIDTNCSIYVLDSKFNLVHSSDMNKNNIIFYYTFQVSEYGNYYVIVKCKNQFGRDIYGYKSIRVVDYFSMLEEKINELVQNASVNITVNITGNLTQAIKESQEDIIGLLLALHSTPETSSECLNSSHRVVYKTASWNINDRVYNITKREVELCQYGCNNATGECYGAPDTGLMNLFWVIIALIGGLIIYWVIKWVRIKDWQ